MKYFGTNRVAKRLFFFLLSGIWIFIQLGPGPYLRKWELMETYFNMYEVLLNA